MLPQKDKRDPIDWAYHVGSLWGLLLMLWAAGTLLNSWWWLYTMKYWWGFVVPVVLFIGRWVIGWLELARRS